MYSQGSALFDLVSIISLASLRMNELKVFLINNVAELPVKVGQLVSQSSLENVVLCNLFVFQIQKSEFESELSPLFFRQQVISFCVVPCLHDLQMLDLFVEWVRLLLFLEALDVL